MNLVENHDQTNSIASGIWRKLKNIRISHGIDNSTLFQFASSIKADIDIYKSSTPSFQEDNALTIARIEELLKEIDYRGLLEKNWSKAYHAEKLSLSLITDDRILFELDRWLYRCKSLKAPFHEFYDKKVASLQNQDPKLIDIKEAKSVLGALSSDIHAFENQRYTTADYAKLAIVRVWQVFTCSLLLFIYVVIVQ